jgi:uncharacterized protein (DUF1330 family)
MSDMKIAILTLSLIASEWLLFPSGSLAQSTDPPDVPGYLLVVGRAFDRDRLAKYSAALPPIYKQAGGAYIGLGRSGAGFKCLHGPCEGRSAVVAHWASYSGVETFWWGARYREAVHLRDRAGAFTVVGLRGVAGAAPVPSGALLLATFGESTDSALTRSWLNSAAEKNAVLLTALASSAVVPLEGDAPFNGVVLLSFTSVDDRDAFVAGRSTAELVNAAKSVSLHTLAAINAPPRR